MKSGQGNKNKLSKVGGKIILGLVGPIASGKGTVAEYLVKKYQATVYKFSDPLGDILDRIYVEKNRENYQNLSSTLRQTFGDDLLASVITQDITKDQNNVIVADGVRREPDIKYFRELPEFHLVKIEADQTKRYERITQRGEKSDDNKKTFAQFQQDEQKEAEQQIQKVAKMAEFTIDNNGSFEQLYQQIEEIIAKLKSNEN